MIISRPRTGSGRQAKYHRNQGLRPSRASRDICPADSDCVRRSFLVVLIVMAIFVSLRPAIPARLRSDRPENSWFTRSGTDFGSAMVVDSTKIASIGSIIQSSAVLERVVKSEKLTMIQNSASARRSFWAQLPSMVPALGSPIPPLIEGSDCRRDRAPSKGHSSCARWSHIYH